MIVGVLFALGVMVLVILDARREDEAFDEILRDIERSQARITAHLGHPMADPNPFPRMRLWGRRR